MRLLTTKLITGEIQDILRTASEFIIIISPYIKVDDDYVERLKTASKKGVRIDFVFGKIDLKDEEKTKLSTIKGINIKYLEELHAKCYVNEKAAIITSMNLYIESEKNTEMGVLFMKSEKTLYDEILEEAKAIREKADKYSLGGYQISEKREPYQNNNDAGHCIRCNKSIPFDIYKPLCLNCYTVWEKHGRDSFYPEKYCHFSGEPSSHDTNFEQPILRKNWEKARRKHNF